MVTDTTIKKGLHDETSVKAGYKQTELGVIPEDWDVKEMEDFTVSVASGKSNTTNELGDYPIYGSTGIIGYKKQSDYAGDKVLIARVGANAGTVNEVSGKYCVSDNTLMVTYQSGIDINFSYYQLINFKLNKLIFGSGQPLVTGSQIKKIAFALPKNKTEQIAIATVLSDTDALIEHLERLIAKKKDLKQGAMQQLLTGRKRLPEFSGEWEVKKLGEVGKTYGGLSGKKKSDFDGGKYPYIPFMNIMNNPVIDLQYFDYVNIQGGEKQNKAIKGDLFFNGSSETPEEVGMCSVLQGDILSLYLNSFCFGFRLNNDLKTDGLYLSYFFRSPIGRQLIFSLAQGATRYNLSKINFMKLEIPYPDPAEQTAIATILSDMDAEIESLEQKRDKYTMLKQGMMQQLLTGRIRIYANN